MRRHSPEQAAVHHDVGLAGEVQQYLPISCFLDRAPPNACWRCATRAGCCTVEVKQLDAPRAAGQGFDLQHIGAQVGQQAGDGVGIAAGEVEHPQTSSGSSSRSFSPTTAFLAGAEPGITCYSRPGCGVPQ